MFTTNDVEIKHINVSFESYVQSILKAISDSIRQLSSHKLNANPLFGVMAYLCITDI